MNAKGQGSLEVLIIFGVLVLAAVVFGVFYFNSHSELQNTKVMSVVDNVGKSISYQKEINPSSIFCGNHLCEPGENCSNCPGDCNACEDPETPLTIYCGDDICDTDESCDTCEDDCGSCGGSIETIDPFCGGDGTIGDPKHICTARGLYNIGHNPHLHYVLNNDIDLSSEAIEASYLPGENAWYDQEKGWEPIGREEGPFTGSFNGNGYSISNIYIKRAEENYVGLFGYVIDAEIKNVHLINAKINANNYVGGLVGYLENSVIENVSTTGGITGNDNIGGLIAKAVASYVSSSFSIVDVTGNDTIGGLISISESTDISDCFSRGTVTGNERFAGFIGVIEGSKVNNSYSAVVVYRPGEEGRNFDAGLILENKDSEVINCYWDTEVSYQENSAGGGVGKKTKDMMKPDTYKKWDFEKTWKIDDGRDYPHLINDTIR